MSAGIRQTPVGIFWDLENCPVPRNKSPSDVIAYIRNFFVFNRLNHREYDFVISCDVTRLRKDIPEDINKAGGYSNDIAEPGSVSMVCSILKAE